jgi:hypothetical protein
MFTFYRRLTARRALCGRFLLPLVLLVLAGAAGCDSQPRPNVSPLQSTLATPSKPTILPQATAIPSPEAGRSNITGVLTNGPNGEPAAGRIVYLLQINWDSARQDGFYMFDEANSPSATTDANGSFLFRDVEARDYVLYAAYQGEEVLNGDILDDKADPSRKWILKAEPDKILNLGQIWFKR